VRHISVLVVVLAFTACSKDKRSSGGGSGSASTGETSSGFDKLTVTHAGKPIAMSRAFIKRIPVDGRFQVLLTDTGGSCAELLDNVFNHMSDNALLFDVGPRLQPDNKTFQTEVTYLYTGPDSAKVKPGSYVTSSGNADKGSKVDITINADITLEGSKHPGAVALHGSFTAEGCGEAELSDKSGIPKAAHPSKATITVAGKSLPVVGAIFKDKQPEPRDGVAQLRTLVLSTGPKDCSSTTQWAAFILERQWGDWHLRGEYLGQERRNNSASDKDGQPETKGMTVTLGAKGDSPDGPTVQVELGGAGTIDGVPVEVKGTVEALDCPET
jgi:hypothetical protein